MPLFSVETPRDIVKRYGLSDGEFIRHRSIRYKDIGEIYAKPVLLTDYPAVITATAPRLAIFVSREAQNRASRW